MRQKTQELGATIRTMTFSFQEHFFQVAQTGDVQSVVGNRMGYPGPTIMTAKYGDGNMNAANTLVVSRNHSFGKPCISPPFR